MQAPPIIAAEAIFALQNELLLFAAVFFAIGMLDEFAVDAVYFCNRLIGRIHTPRVDEHSLAREKLSGMAAVFIPA